MNIKTKNILIASGVVLCGLTAYIIYKKIQKKSQVTTAVKAVTTGNIKTLGINIPSIAQQIGIDSGFAYPVLDPRHWTENDTALKESILKVPKPLIPTLITAYYNLYKRNLQQDMQSVLDDYNSISYLFE
jgi:hypothetical protein